MTTVRTPAPSRSPRLTLPILVLIGALAAVAPIGTDMYLPALPTMASQLSTTAAWTQLTLTAFSIGLAVGQLVLGTLSDRLGRRRLLIGGAALLAISTVVCVIAPTVQWLIVGRIVMGISGAAGIVIGRAIAADLTTGVAAARVFSLLGLIAGIGPIVGPLLGGVVLAWAGWRAIFIVIAVFAALLLLGVLALVPETLPPQNRSTGGFREFLHTAGGILKRPHFLGFSIAFWFAFGGMFAYISASPFVVQRILGLSPGVFTVLFAINAAGIVTTGSLSAWLVARVRASTLAGVGLGLQLLGGLTLLVVALVGASPAAVILPAMFLIAAPMGLVMGNCTALAVTGVRARGTAMALLGCIQFVVAGIVAPLVGLAGELSLLPLAVVATGCTIIALCGLAFGRAADSGSR